MQKLILIFLAMVAYEATAQMEKAIDLENFSKIYVSGNVEANLVRSNRNHLKVETGDGAELEKYTHGVANDEFFFTLQENSNEKNKKIVIVLEYTHVEKIKLDGIIKLTTEQPIESSHLSVKASGILKGKLQVSVNELDVRLSGIVVFQISGKAVKTNIFSDGITKVNTRKLESGILKQIQETSQSTNHKM